jgi:hypothetical protein
MTTTNQTENRLRSRTFRGTAALSKFRVATQGADSSDFFRTVIQAAAVTDVPAGITRNAIVSGEEGSVGQEGEFPCEVAAAVAVNDLLIVDAIGGIGRIKPVGSQQPPYWIVGIARTLQATIGSVCQVEWRPRYVPAANGNDVYTADGHRQTVGPFCQDNVAASQAAVALSIGAPAKTQIGHTMTRPGSLVGISALSNVAAAGSAALLTVTKNGVATALTTTLVAATNGGLKNSNTAAKDAVTFVANDVIGVTVTTDGAWSATTADINVEVQFED